MESSLRVITSKENIYIALKEEPDKFSKFMEINKEVLKLSFKLEANLHLHSNEIMTLEEIIEINQCLHNNQIDTAENILKIINFFSTEKSLILDKKQELLISNFNKLYKFLEDSVGKDEYFPKLMSIIFKNECSKTSLKKYISKLLEIAMSKNELVYNCYSILKLIFTFSNKPEDMEKNIENIQNENNELLMILYNYNNMEYLDEIIINFLEYKILIFFENIPCLDYEKNESYKEYFKTYYNYKEEKNIKAESFIVYDLPNHIFDKCIKLLDAIIEGEVKIKNEHLCKLYSITYIKIYLYKLVSFINTSYEYMLDVNSLFKPMNNKDSEFRYILKIYVFKIVFNLLNKNWEDLLNYNFCHHQIYFYDILDEIEKEENEKSSSFLINYFLPINYEEEEKEFLQQNEIFEIFKNRNFLNFPVDIQNDNFDIFLTISINRIISNLGLKYYSNKPEYSNFSKLCENLFENYGNSLRDLLFLFYNEKKFNNILKPKIEKLKKNKNFEGNLFESLLYGFRFCVHSLLNKNINNENSEKFLYSSILSKLCLNTINEYFIPGNFSIRDLRLETIKDIENYLKRFPLDIGCYVCSCGYYYIIHPFDLPTREHNFNCPNCKLPMGFEDKAFPDKVTENPRTTIRTGHYRIIKNKAQNQEQIGIWNNADENIPNLSLEDYKKTVIEPLLNKSNKGINICSKEIFLNNQKIIRKLSQIGYRLLNFILYNHLFYANCLEYISDLDLEEKLISGMNILEIIQNSWNLLEEALKEKNIL